MAAKRVVIEFTTGRFKGVRQIVGLADFEAQVPTTITTQRPSGRTWVGGIAMVQDRYVQYRELDPQP